jgi:hypothetical protein
LRWIDALQFNVSSEGEKHPEYRGKPKADFEGDINPKTGEVGGPKKEPLSWQGEVSLLQMTKRQHSLTPFSPP